MQHLFLVLLLLSSLAFVCAEKASKNHVSVSSPNGVQLSVAGQGRQPNYQYSFGPGAGEYNVNAGLLVETTSSSGVPRPVPGSVVALSSLQWTLTPAHPVPVNGRINFNLTGVPRRGGPNKHRNTRGATNKKRNNQNNDNHNHNDDGDNHPGGNNGNNGNNEPRFNSITFANHITLTTHNANGTVSFGFLKIDIIIDHYRFVVNGSKLALGFVLHGPAGPGRLASRNAYHIGDGSFTIQPEATAYPSGQVVDVTLVDEPSGPGVWIVYDHFPSGNTLVHDPELGYVAPADRVGLVVSPFVFIAAAFACVIVVAVFSTIYILRRRRQDSQVL